jgi:hypothetical protein
MKTPEQNRLYKRSINGFLTNLYSKMKYRSKGRKHPLPNFSKDEFISWAYEHGYETLHKNWVYSEYSKDETPSVDRKKDSLPYTFDNMTLTTWKVNNAKGLRDRQVGNTITWQNKTVYMFSKDKKLIRTFHSTGAAHRAVGGGQAHISDCCVGKRKSAAGYLWSYNKSMLPEEVDEQLTLD